MKKKTFYFFQLFPISVLIALIFVSIAYQSIHFDKNQFLIKKKIRLFGEKQKKSFLSTAHKKKKNHVTEKVLFGLSKRPFIKLTTGGHPFMGPGTAKRGTARASSAQLSSLTNRWLWFGISFVWFQRTRLLVTLRCQSVPDL